MAKVNKIQRRLRRKIGVRKKIEGTPERPRICVFRSNKHIYAQIIDDVNQKTLASHSDSGEGKANKTEKAKQVGLELGKKAVANKIQFVVFDRSGYKYHGRIKALADGLREAGVNF